MISRQCAQLRFSEADPQFWQGWGPARDLRERGPEVERERRLGMNVVATASPAWSRWEMSNGMRRHSMRRLGPVPLRREFSCAVFRVISRARLA